MKFLITALLILFDISGYSQTDSVYNLNSYTPIDPGKLAGIWHKTDSTQQEVEFSFLNDDFVLKSSGSGMHFMEQDSSGKIIPTGYIPMWPPIDFNLILISDDSLRIDYFQIQRYTGSVLYVR